MGNMADEDPTLFLPSALLGSTGFLLFKVGVAAKREINGDIGIEGCTMRHYAVLACLDEFGAMTQRDIAERMLFDASDVVDIIDFLESNGYVNRFRNEVDRRRYDVTITSAGLKELRLQNKRTAAATEQFLSALNEDERSTLHDMLLRVFATHDQRVPQA